MPGGAIRCDGTGGVGAMRGPGEPEPPPVAGRIPGGLAPDCETPDREGGGGM